MSTIMFKEVVTADKAANTKANGLWGKMVMFVSQEPAKSFNLEGLKDYLKNREAEAKDEDSKWKPSGAYRSNKSLIVRCKRLSVSLLNGASGFRGKTEVQDECNEIEHVERTPYEQFSAAMEVVSKKLKKLESGQLTTAAAVIGNLAKTVREQIEGVMQQKAA